MFKLVGYYFHDGSLDEMTVEEESEESLGPLVT